MFILFRHYKLILIPLLVHTINLLLYEFFSSSFNFAYTHTIDSHLYEHDQYEIPFNKNPVHSSSNLFNT